MAPREIERAKERTQVGLLCFRENKKETSQQPLHVSFSKWVPTFLQDSSLQSVSFLKNFLLMSLVFRALSTSATKVKDSMNEANSIGSGWYNLLSPKMFTILPWACWPRSLEKNMRPQYRSLVKARRERGEDAPCVVPKQKLCHVLTYM